MENLSFGPEFIDVNASNSLLENTFCSDNSLMEVEMPPTDQGEQGNAEPQENFILKDLQPVQEQNCSNIG